MKVHVYGNTLNIGFHAVQQLRKIGIEAILFLDQTSKFGHDFPWWEDSKLTPENLPSWIKFYKTYPFFLMPSKETRRMINDFKDCDVALVSCWGPILASKAKVKFLFYSIGSDLNCISLVKDLKSVFYARLTLKQRILRSIKIATYSTLQKRAIIKRASHIFVFMGYQEKPFISDFGLWHKTSREMLLWDVDNYKIQKVTKVLEHLNIFKIVFFMVARHSWASLWNDPKGNDKFIKAYARFVKKFEPNAILICIEKGNDVDKSKSLVKSLGIDKYIKWVSIMDKEGIRNYESINNCVVVDQFGHDDWLKKFPSENNVPKMGFGFTAIEALAASKPLITAFTDIEYFNNTLPPILYANTEQEIYERICEVYQMDNIEREELGKKGSSFLQQWYNNNNINVYANKLKAIANQ
jgi:Glycosyl transferases group 1